MALNLPTTAKEISQRAKVDVRREIASSDPFLARSYLGSIISGICNRIFEFYDAIRDSEDEANPLTAVRNRLKWANTYGLNLLPGSPATGQAFINAYSGGGGTAIPVNTRLVNGAGDIYVVQMGTVLGGGTLTINTLTRVGTLATATTAGNHLLASNAVVTTSGASPAEYNVVGTKIMVISATQFTYVMTADPGGVGGGSPIVATLGATVLVNAEDSGEEFNLDADAELDFETPIAGVESPAMVTFGGVIDGTDLETGEAIQARLADLLQNPVSFFSSALIKKTLLGIPGNTRVFVQEETPAVGQVTTYFMRDNDDDPIPSAAEVAAALASIIAIKPAHTADADVIVLAPVEVSTDFDFTAASLVPDTASMRVALADQLAEFFEKRPTPGVSIVQDAYRSAIFNTVDTATGQRISSFVLTKPTVVINAQDETSYDNSPTTEGVFSGGTGHAAPDVITLATGVTITVDAVGGGGVVTQFTVGNAADLGAIAGSTYAQASTTGGGSNFTLTPDMGNLEPATNLNVQAGQIRTLGTVTFT